MVKITQDLIFSNFDDILFFTAYRHALKVFDEQRFFENTAWRLLEPRTDSYYRECIEEKFKRIMNDRTIDDTINGYSIERDLGEFPGIRVYEYITTRVAQRIRIVKSSLFPPRRGKVMPYIGVDIWTDESLYGIDVVAKARNKNGGPLDLPRTMDGFPIEYRLTPSCRESCSRYDIFKTN